MPDRTGDPGRTLGRPDDMKDNLGNRFTAWQGPGAPPPRGRGIRGVFERILAMIIPPRSQRFLPTATGYFLIVVAVAVCIAAYNTGSNILFISLSLILAALLLSGALSWINFRSLRWRLHADPPFRADEKAAVLVEVLNGKKLLPTYSISFRIRARPSGKRGRLFLERRLDPGCPEKMPWTFVPLKRGIERITLSGAVSEFPFGFLRKASGRILSLNVVVWPARIAYETQEPRVSREYSIHGNSAWRLGQGEDLVNLRDYQQGDSQRLIHWKASAKVRRLQVRQFAAENQSAYFFFLQTSRKLWRDPEQFERFCRFVLSLAEDLFQENRISGASIDDRPALDIRRYIDLSGFFDQLATLTMSEQDRHRAVPLKNNLITFEPYGRSGIIACTAGETIATA